MTFFNNWKPAGFPLILLLSLTVSVTVAAQDHAREQPQARHNETDNHHDSRLIFDEEQLRDFGGKTAIAGTGVIHRQVSLPGEIKLNEEAVAHITPRFPAKILEVRVRTGDEVKAGDILALAESSETLARFELKSLIDGVVIRRHLTLGEHLSPSNTAFVVADLSTLWADIALYPRQIPLVNVGQPVQITTGHGPAPVDARIDYVAPLVDEKTRTGLARIFLENGNRVWRPGMFIEANITLDKMTVAVAVPKTAVIDMAGTATVFTKRAGHWEPRRVQPGREDSDSVEIVRGLEPGEEYIADGGFILKAQLHKSEFESGHNH